MNLKCPKCGFIENDEERFRNTEVGCEDCGSHSAIQCPNCDEYFDHVWEGEVCLECGLILRSYEKCPEHPDAETTDWRFDLDRGG